MVPTEVRQLLEKIVNERLKNIEDNTAEKIYQLTERVEELETELKIVKEGDNL